MDMKRLIGLSTTLLASSIASAGTMGPVATSQSFHPVIAIQGGYASLNASNNEALFIGTDLDRFDYSNTNNQTNGGFIGAFLGAENSLDFLAYPGIFMQLGVEYDYYSPYNVDGVNTVGINNNTLTTWAFNYQVQTQQVMGLLRLYGTYDRFYPYGEVGLGAAFNEADKYNVTVTSAGSNNLTPLFSRATQTQFSYNLGFGVEAAVMSNVRVGLGYRYSNFGSFNLGDGGISFNNYQFPVPFTLSGSNAYTNQLLARISYVA
ncbi:MAG: outer membrane beta-barrel protein [Legionella sp.]|jgi:opacity protein-like surface antigen